MGKVRIKDIAEIANVSIGTVDRVIHNRGEVSPATREKIRKLLDEYNYKPDMIASSLALKREIRLAVVMPGPVNDHAFWELPQRALIVPWTNFQDISFLLIPIISTSLTGTTL